MWTVSGCCHGMDAKVDADMDTDEAHLLSGHQF